MSLSSLLDSSEEDSSSRRDAHARSSDGVGGNPSSTHTAGISEEDYEEFMVGGIQDRIEDLFTSKLADSKRAEVWSKTYACPTCTIR